MFHQYFFLQFHDLMRKVGIFDCRQDDLQLTDLEIDIQFIHTLRTVMEACLISPQVIKSSKFS